jgi:hemerythrin
MIQWTKQFETGFKQIDEQHQMLIFNINHLETHLTSTNPTKAEFEFLVHLVDFLGAYADAHFKLEEQCMECNRCPVHEQNRQAHEAYRSIFRNYKARCAGEGFTVELLRALHESASVWVREHILKIDTQLRPFIPVQSAVH